MFTAIVIQITLFWISFSFYALSHNFNAISISTLVLRVFMGEKRLNSIFAAILSHCAQSKLDRYLCAFQSERPVWWYSILRRQLVEYLVLLGQKILPRQVS